MCGADILVCDQDALQSADRNGTAEKWTEWRRMGRVASPRRPHPVVSSDPKSLSALVATARDQSAVPALSAKAPYPAAHPIRFSAVPRMSAPHYLPALPGNSLNNLSFGIMSNNVAPTLRGGKLSRRGAPRLH